MGKHGHRVRFVLTGTASVRRRAESLTEPGTWLKVCGRRDEVLPLLDSAWRVGDPEYLMSVPVAGGDARIAAPAGYSSEIVAERGFHEVVVRREDGAHAARGRVAVHGATAVVDQVVTEPDHRRRGLGRVVMDGLRTVAAAHGATTAVLVSTVEGRHLYRTLGWQVDSEMVAAHLPEPAIAA
ncbi:GNAT family N-acetyltransferase [Nocardia sp. IFM 10818]